MSAAQVLRRGQGRGKGVGNPGGPEQGHAPTPALQKGPRGEAPQHGPRGAHHSPALLLEDGPAGRQSDHGGGAKTPGARTLGPGHLMRGPSQGLGQGVPCSVPQSPRQQSGDNSPARWLRAMGVCLPGMSEHRVSGGSMNWDDTELRAESRHSPTLSCARCRAPASLSPCTHPRTRPSHQPLGGGRVHKVTG